ncbi:hypothetical protein ACHAXS_002005 [Conticribra weissflogii]
MSSLFRKSNKRKRTSEGATQDPASITNESSASLAPKILCSSSASANNNNHSSSSITTTFSDLNLCPALVQTCRKLGFHGPTPVQRAIIPLILNPELHPSDAPSATTSLSSSSSSSPPGPSHLLTLSATGSGKTAAFALPLLHLLSLDPYGIFALILTPTRELAKQIQQQILALGSGGSGWRITCALIIGGEDVTRQSLDLAKQPNFVVGTPGRLAELCRDGDGSGLYKPNFKKVRFVVLDEADRLLSAKSGFERDVAEVLLQSTTTAVGQRDGDEEEEVKRRRVRRRRCRTLLFSATMTRSLKSLEEMAGAGVGRLPLMKVVVRPDGSWDSGAVAGMDGEKKDDDESKEKKKKKEKVENSGDHAENESNDSDNQQHDNDNDKSNETESEDEDEGTTPNIPAGLRQEYIFMPSRVREAYLLCAIRNLMTNGGRGKSQKELESNNYIRGSSGWNFTTAKDIDISDILGDNNADDEAEYNDNSKSKHPKAQSAIIFVPTCERAAHISGILTQLGIHNVALHSLLSQNRRLAALGTFQSQRVRVLVATDVASRGLDVPEVDLVINAELPRRAVDYVHRVGRTARAGRRGRAVSLVGEQDIDLVHAAEEISGRKLEKCEEVTDEMAVRLLGPVAKASRLTKMKLMDIGFDELVKKHRERKKRDRRLREKAERRAKKAVAKLRETKKG